MCQQFVQENEKQSDIEMTKRHLCIILIVKLQVVNNVRKRYQVMTQYLYMIFLKINNICRNT